MYDQYREFTVISAARAMLGKPIILSFRNGCCNRFELAHTHHFDDICFRDESARPDIVAHEIAHVVTRYESNDLESHGPDFAGILLTLIRHLNGRSTARRLRIEYRWHGLGKVRANRAMARRYRRGIHPLSTRDLQFSDRLRRARQAQRLRRLNNTTLKHELRAIASRDRLKTAVMEVGEKRTSGAAEPLLTTFDIAHAANKSDSWVYKTRRSQRHQQDSLRQPQHNTDHLKWPFPPDLVWVRVEQ